MPEPLYTSENCRIAYQLNWSVSLFANAPLPERSAWLNSLAEMTERDDVRILECHVKDRLARFLASTKPRVAPAQVVRSLKGRLQHLLREVAPAAFPRAFRRNYRIESVGEVNNAVLQAYVGRQAERHPMADERVQRRLESLQFHDASVDLTQVRHSAHGQFVCNLHFVLENAGRLNDARDAALKRTRDMLLGACAKKRFRLSRIGLAPNHVHVLLGCDVSDAPLEVGLSLLNNLAFAHGMKRVYEFGFYVGGFGGYDRDAIRRVVGSTS